MGSFLTIREVAHELETSEDNILVLISQNKLKAYHIAGEYLRLDPQEVLQLKNLFLSENNSTESPNKTFFRQIIHSFLLFFALTSICCLVLIFVVFKFL